MPIRVLVEVVDAQVFANSIRYFFLFLATSFSATLIGATLCPNGQYVDVSPCVLCPDGSYIGGGACSLTPNGQYVKVFGDAVMPILTPNGSYVSGVQGAKLCPDGSYVSGSSCLLTPNGRYIGE